MFLRQIGLAVLIALGLVPAARALEMEGFRRAAEAYENRMMQNVQTLVISGHRTTFNGGVAYDALFTDMVKGNLWRRETRVKYIPPLDYQYAEPTDKPVRAHPAPPADGVSSAISSGDSLQKPPPPPPPQPEKVSKPAPTPPPVSPPPQPVSPSKPAPLPPPPSKPAPSNPAPVVTPPSKPVTPPSPAPQPAPRVERPPAQPQSPPPQVSTPAPEKPVQPVRTRKGEEVQPVTTPNKGTTSTTVVRQPARAKDPSVAQPVTIPRPKPRNPRRSGGGRGGNGEVWIPSPDPGILVAPYVAPGGYAPPATPDSEITVDLFDGQSLWHIVNGYATLVPEPREEDLIPPTIPGHDYWWDLDTTAVIKGSEHKTTRNCWMIETDSLRLWIDKDEFFLVQSEEKLPFDRGKERTECSSFIRIGDGYTIPSHIDHYVGKDMVESEYISEVAFNRVLPDELFIATPAPQTYPPSDPANPPDQRPGKRGHMSLDNKK